MLWDNMFLWVTSCGGVCDGDRDKATARSEGWKIDNG